eukprot:761508-Hanusia_phi.AAC.2
MIRREGITRGVLFFLYRDCCAGLHNHASFAYLAIGQVFGTASSSPSLALMGLHAHHCSSAAPKACRRSAVSGQAGPPVPHRPLAARGHWRRMDHPGDASGEESLLPHARACNLPQPPKQGTVWARPRPEVGEVQEMGFGSFGRIYLATDLKTGQEVRPAVVAPPLTSSCCRWRSRPSETSDRK